MNRLIASLALLSLPALAAPNDRVDVNLDAFLALIEKTKTPTPPVAPVAASLTTASYDGKVQGETAVFTAKLRVENHRDAGWIQIPLLAASSALIDAKVAGKPASVTLAGDWYTLITDAKGAIDIEVTFATAVVETQGVHNIGFPLAPSGGTTLSLSVPVDSPIDLRIPQGRVLTDATAGGLRKLSVALSARDRFAAAWQRTTTETQTTPTAEDTRLYTESTTRVDLADGLLHASTTLHHTVLFGGLDQFRYDIPDGLVVLDVKGAGVREWKVDDKGDLTLDLGFVAEGAWDVTIEAERPVAMGGNSVDAPIITPFDGDRFKGWLGVTAGGNLEIAPGTVSGASPVDVRQLPADIIGTTTQPVLLGYKFLAEDASIPLVVTAHEQVDVLVTLLDRAQAVSMMTSDGRRLTQVVYEVRNNRRQYLDLFLPEGAELWSASVAGRAVQPSRGPKGQILLPLVRSASSGGALSGFSVEVVYVENGKKASKVRAELPHTDVPTTWVGWTVYVPDDTKTPKNSFDGNMAHVESLDAPQSSLTLMQDRAYQGQAELAAEAQVKRGGLDSGAAPVQVNVPLEGRPMSFEKLLALDETLWISFDLKGGK